MKSDNNLETRRNFLKKTIAAGSLLPLINKSFLTDLDNHNNNKLKVHIFSKHLQFLDYEDMAQAAVDLGFDGVDLTVRPGGHVLPENVEQDLPKAVEALNKVGLKPLMMTTAVDNPNDQTDKKVLTTAANLGIKYYRMNYYDYPKDKSIPEAIEYFKKKAKDLSQFNEEEGIIGCYQNHAGDYVGASIWELWEVLKNVEEDYMGVQYDIRHAVVEGGQSWQNGLRLIQPLIKTIVLKDFRYEKKNGKWQVQNTPIGEGMVDFAAYFKLLKKYQVQVPVSLHLEYPIGGAEHGLAKLKEGEDLVFNAMKSDLQKIREIWRQA